VRITLDIPDFKFKAGDVIRRRNIDNSEAVYLHVYYNVVLDGVWRTTVAGTHVQVDHAYYTCVVLPGSVCDNENLKPLRPGMWLSLRADDVEERSELIAWEGALVDPDTPENTFDRMAEWEKVTR
jgi:hypothetical protein